MRLPLKRAARTCSCCSSIFQQELPPTVYQVYYPVSAVVCPNNLVSHLALEMYTEVMLPRYPIDFEQAFSVCPLERNLGACGLGR